MAPKKHSEAITILLDVGSNMSQVTHSGETCLKASIECISQIMLRKMFSESPDQFALILFGSKETDNNLANENEYRNIAVVTKHFSTANWKTLRAVKELEVNVGHTGDWLDAIVVAVQFMKDESETKIFSQLKIVLFSNFNSPVSADKVDVIVSTMKNMDIDLTVIGPDVPTDAASGELVKKKYKEGEILISSMVDEGTLCSFEDAASELMHLQRKTVKPTPWNAMLVISSQIKIPIRAFKRIAEVRSYKWTTGMLDDEAAPVMKERGYMKYDEEHEMETEVQREEVIDAYKFGTTIVPFSDIDKATMNYQSGRKGLYLIACTPRETVPQYLSMEKGSYIVLPKQDDTVGTRMLESFIQALYDNNYVGIARRVYIDNSAARIGALYPEVTEESRYLIYVQLPFAEDEHVYKFPSLSHMQFSNEQTEAVDALIDSMDLDETDTKAEMYEVSRMHDPDEQYKLQCLGHKGLYGNQPIPDEINEKMAKLLHPTPELIEASRSPLEKIKEVFPLEKVIQKTKKSRFNSDAVDAESLENEVKPNSLFRKTDSESASRDLDLDSVINGKSFLDVCSELQTNAENYINSDSADVSKLLRLLKYLRKNSRDNDANVYNSWVAKLKSLIVEKHYSSIWNDIIDEKLGLITKLESPNTGVDPETAEEFLKLKKTDDDSVYGSMNTNSIDDGWLDDL